MSQIVLFPSRQHLQPPEGEPDTHINVRWHEELLEQLKRERENLIDTTNYLEALRARLGQQV